MQEDPHQSSQRCDIEIAKKYSKETFEEKIAPLKYVRIKQCTAPWMTNEWDTGHNSWKRSGFFIIQKDQI